MQSNKNRLMETALVAKLANFFHNCISTPVLPLKIFTNFIWDTCESGDMYM